MSPDDLPISAASFTGQWIGETQDLDMPAHIWEITLQGPYLSLTTKWEGETESSTFFAEMVPGKPSFKILQADEATATLLDKQHFVIPDWVWRHRKNPDGSKASYDVVFSRPGIAELTARSVYLKSLEQRQITDEAAS